MVVLAHSLLTAALTFNVAQCLRWNFQTMGVAAACAASPTMFCFSFSHGGHIGMIFEMVGTVQYEDMDHTIQRAVEMLVCQREDGELLHQKVTLQLRQPNQLPLTQ